LKILCLQTEKIKLEFTITRYIGKARFAKLVILTAAKLVSALNAPVVYGQVDSVSGCFHDLMMVGNAAVPSLAIANIIAMLASFVINQRIRASNDKIPQI
jgi:hypothetical protein